MRNLLILLLLFFNGDHVLANIRCDTVYHMPDVSASYKKGAADVIEFIQQDILPVVLAFDKKEGKTTRSLYLSLEIDAEGRINMVEFRYRKLSKACQEAVAEKFLGMMSWCPAYHKGVAVCTRLSIPIKCINYQ